MVAYTIEGSPVELQVSHRTGYKDVNFSFSIMPALLKQLTNLPSPPPLDDTNFYILRLPEELFGDKYRAPEGKKFVGNIISNLRSNGHTEFMSSAGMFGITDFMHLEKRNGVWYLVPNVFVTPEFLHEMAVWMAALGSVDIFDEVDIIMSGWFEI